MRSLQNETVIPFVHYDKRVRIPGALYGDVRDYHSVEQAVKDVDVVYHLAALIGIPYSYESPDSYVATNIIGTTNVLQAALKHRVKRVIIMSSSEVYGSALWTPIGEDHPLQAQSPYAATKIAAEKLAESFFKTYDLPVTIVRPFNTYGPRQSFRAVIPTIIGQLMRSSIVMLGETKAVRDLTFVTDMADALALVYKNEALIGETVNIASGERYSIGEIAEKLINLLNPAASVELDKTRVRPEKSEVMVLQGDSALFKRATGWNRKINIDAGLEMTARWYLENKNDMKEYCT